MLVFRIEHEQTKKGPYRPKNFSVGFGEYHKKRCRKPENRLALDLCYKHSEEQRDTHPTPFGENLSTGRNKVCGFAKLSQLKQWFKGFRSRLRQNGYVMRVFDIPSRFVETGNFQVVFTPSKAVKISTKKIP